MDLQRTIPLEGRRDDPLRYGIHGVKSDIIEPHPLESAYHDVISLIDYCIFSLLFLTFFNIIFFVFAYSVDSRR